MKAPRWRRPVKPVKPHPCLTLVVAMREIADNPEQTEGALRHVMRTAAGVLEQQHALLERMRRQLAWRYGWLAALFGVMAAYHLGLLVWQHWLRGPMIRNRYYRLRGHEIEETDLLGWCAMWKEPEARRVAKTRVGQREVSTVFLGLDHRFGGDGPPLLFETMTFDLDSGADDGCWRYATWREAELGHQEIVQTLQGAVVT